MFAVDTVTFPGLLFHALCILAAGACTGMILYSKRLPPVSRKISFNLLAIGSSVWVLVAIIALVNYLAGGGETVPSWVALIHFFWMIPMVAGVISYMLQTKIIFDQAFIVTSMVTVVSVLGFYWSIVLHTIVRNTDISFGLWVLCFLFPIGNVIVLSIFFVHLTNRPGTQLRELLLFGSGYTFVGFSDANLVLRLSEGNYSRLAAYNLGYCVGPMLITLGLACRFRALSRAQTTSTVVFRDRYFSDSYVPYLPLIAYSIFEAVASHNRLDGYVANSLLALGIILAVMAISRYQRINARERLLLEGNVVEQSTELARSHLLNQRIIGVAADGIVAVDPFDRVVLINRAALDILGFVSTGAGVPTIPSHVHELFHRDKACSGQCSINQTLHDSSRESHTITLDTPQQQIIIELSVRSLDGPTGGYVLVFHDITEQVSLANLKDEFILLVSHEIRTPLTSIRGSLGLLEHGVLGDFSDEARNMISVALQNSDRLLRLINDVLDLERMETGKRPMHLQWQTVELIFDEVVRGLQPLAQESGITLVTDHRNCSVMVDHDRIVQVLVNLVQNAIKFSPPNSAVTLSIDIFPDHATFSVADEGRGIPTDHLDKVFEAFHQVDASDTRDKSGTGLGLAISREIVTSHGGHIWAEARPAGGTIFKFTIPMWSTPAEISAHLNNKQSGDHDG